MNLFTILLSTIVVVNGFPFEKVVEDPLPVNMNQLGRIVEDPIKVPLNFPSLKKINEPYASELYDGDMVLTPEQKQYINALGNNGELQGFRGKRGAPIVLARRWDKTQPIPFYFAANITESARVKIRAATKIMSANTCLDYKENGNGPTKIHFYNGGGCSSYLGAPTPGFDSPLSMRTGCEENPVTVLHEMTHNLGLTHTQNRFDRDLYITMNLNAIKKGSEHNYEKLTVKENDNFGLPYEYGSAMHYGPYYWHDNKGPIMISKDPAYEYTMGQSRYMTFNDYKLINILYNCSGNCKTNLKCENGGYIHPRDCNKCVCNDFYTGTRCERENQVQNIQTKYTTVYERNQKESDFPEDFTLWNKDSTKLLKAPIGRRLNVTITRMDNGYYKLGCSSCDWYGVELSDGDLSLVGKTFCCEKHRGVSFISKTNVVGYKAYSIPGYPFYATVTYTVV